MNTVADPVAPVEVERPPVDVEQLEALLDGGDNRGKWHIVSRRNARHALCGAPIAKDAPARALSIGDDDNCMACEAIARRWVDGKGWEGYGKRGPGREFTDDLRRYLANE